MSKCLKLVAMLLCVAGTATAQVVVDTLQSDNYDFTFETTFFATRQRWQSSI